MLSAVIEVLFSKEDYYLPTPVKYNLNSATKMQAFYRIIN